MEKFKITENQIYNYSDNTDEVVLTFPLSNDVPVYDKHTGRMDYREFVIDMDGKLYLIKPRKAALTGDKSSLNVLAVMPDRTMNDAEIVGWKLKCARQDAGLTCEEVADRAGVRLNTVELVESGRFNAKINLICSLAEAIGAEMSFTPME